MLVVEKSNFILIWVCDVDFCNNCLLFDFWEKLSFVCNKIGIVFYCKTIELESESDTVSKKIII